MVLTAESVAASLPPFLVLEASFYLLRESSGSIGLKIASALLFLIASNLCQCLVVGFQHVAQLRRVLAVNVIMWFSFFVLVGVDAFTVHRGLAKNVEPTAINFVLWLCKNLALFGVLLTLFNVGISKLTGKLCRG